jgi:hypothetical protein
MQWVPVVTRQGREADHSPPSNAEVKKDGATPRLPHVPLCFKAGGQEVESGLLVRGRIVIFAL